jgi:hypothetical protein
MQKVAKSPVVCRIENPNSKSNPAGGIQKTRQTEKRRNLQESNKGDGRKDTRVSFQDSLNDTIANVKIDPGPPSLSGTMETAIGRNKVRGRNRAVEISDDDDFVGEKKQGRWHLAKHRAKAKETRQVRTTKRSSYSARESKETPKP